MQENSIGASTEKDTNTSPWTTRLRATARSPEIPGFDTRLCTEASSSISGSLSNNGCDWGTHRKRGSGLRAVGNRERDSSLSSVDSDISHSTKDSYNNSLPRRDRREEQVKSKHTTSSGLAPTKVKSTTKKSSLHHATIELSHKALAPSASHRRAIKANDDNIVENSRSLVLGNQTTTDSVVRRPRSLEQVTPSDDNESRANDCSNDKHNFRSGMRINKSNMMKKSSLKNQNMSKTISDNELSRHDKEYERRKLGETTSDEEILNLNKESTSRRFRKKTTSDDDSSKYSTSLSRSLGEKTTSNDESNEELLGKSRPKITRPKSKIMKKVDFTIPEGNNQNINESNEENHNVEDYLYLIGKTHRDNEDYQRYITEKVYIDRRSGNIVGERVLLLKDGKKHRVNDPIPIHIQDIVVMTEEYDQEISSKNIQALVTQLIDTTNQSERSETDTLLGYCLHGEIQS